MPMAAPVVTCYIEIYRKLTRTHKSDNQKRLKTKKTDVPDQRCGSPIQHVRSTPTAQRSRRRHGPCASTQANKQSIKVCNEQYKRNKKETRIGSTDTTAPQARTKCDGWDPSQSAMPQTQHRSSHHRTALHSTTTNARQNQRS